MKWRKRRAAEQNERVWSWDGEEKQEDDDDDDDSIHLLYWSPKQKFVLQLVIVGRGFQRVDPKEQKNKKMFFPLAGSLFLHFYFYMYSNNDHQIEANKQMRQSAKMRKVY